MNYLLTPLQLLLIIPQLRFGEWLLQAPAFPVTLDSGLALIAQGVLPAIRVLGIAIVHATLGWLVLAPLLTLALYFPLAASLRSKGDSMTSLAMNLLERDLVPDFLIRRRIRSLLAARLREEDQGDPERQQNRFSDFLRRLTASPVAIETAAANEQHYEVPTEFYQKRARQASQVLELLLPASGYRAGGTPGRRGGTHAGAHLRAGAARGWRPHPGAGVRLGQPEPVDGR